MRRRRRDEEEEEEKEGCGGGGGGGRSSLVRPPTGTERLGDGAQATGRRGGVGGGHRDRPVQRGVTKQQPTERVKWRKVIRRQHPTSLGCGVLIAAELNPSVSR